MASDTKQILRHQIDFTLYDLPSTTVRIDFPPAAQAENVMLTTMPMIRFGASYANVPALINNLSVQPRRIQFDISSPPALLPITLQVVCGEPFIFGWLTVPETVQTSIATVVERIRIIGPSYWALPLGEGVLEPARKLATGKSATEKPATEKLVHEKSAGEKAGVAKSVENIPSTKIDPVMEKSPESTNLPKSIAKQPAK